MQNKRNRDEESKLFRVALTARLSLEAYNAITEIQRRYRTRKGKALPIWKVIDSAVKDYAEKQGIKIEE